jgi:hypothetical protein
MLPDPTQRPLHCPYEPFTVVWGDIPRLCGMDADGLFWMSRDC